MPSKIALFPKMIYASHHYGGIDFCDANLFQTRDLSNLAFGRKPLRKAFPTLAEFGSSRGENMFQDSLIAVMAMMLLCFSGMLLMFVFMVRAITALADAQKESFHRQQLYLAQLEQQCIDLKAMLQSSMNKTPAAEQDAAHSSRLLRAQDPLESMLEETASKFDGMASHSENAGLSFMPELSFGPAESGGPPVSGPSVRASCLS